MKSVVFVVFLASVAMFPRWSKADNPYCPDAGVKANAALKNLLEDGKAIDSQLFSGRGCISDIVQKAERKDQFVRVVYDKVCYAVGVEKDDPEYPELAGVWVLSKTKELDSATDVQAVTIKDCTNKKPYQSLYLPQEDNKNTYMILDPQMAVLFFTTKLSGCDVFIAKNPNKPNQPLVVHSNRNDLPVETHEKENIKLKGEDVDKILQTTTGYTGYKVVVRVYHKPDNKDTQKVLDDYKTNHNQAEMIEYDYTGMNQFFHFIGIFEKSGWKFFLKRDDGKIIWKKCLNQQGSCVIM